MRIRILGFVDVQSVNGAATFSRLFAAFLWQKHRMDIRQDTARGNRDTTKELVQLLVVLDGKSDVTGHDTALLVVTGGVASKLQDFGAEVLQDGSKVHGGTSSHTSGILAPPSPFSPYLSIHPQRRILRIALRVVQLPFFEPMDFFHPLRSVISSNVRGVRDPLPAPFIDLMVVTSFALIFSKYRIFFFGADLSAFAAFLAVFLAAIAIPFVSVQRSPAR